MNNFKNKKVLVAGGTGMIGRPLVQLLLEEGAQVHVVSMDDPSRAVPGATFDQLDLRDFNHCLKCCQGQDYVFNLLCVKGSPAVTTTQPASFFVSSLRYNTNLMEAARLSKVNGFLFTSTLGVYGPAEIFYEDDVWKTFPSENDKFAGWAKRMGELQAEAYAIEYGWNNISIVRPANIYGPYDNFSMQNAMVVPSLIRKAVNGENPICVWGDGSQTRDFLHVDDAAKGILLVAKCGERRPVNIGSGQATSIRQLLETIVSHLEKKPEIVWDTSKPLGDKKRILDISRAKELGFKPNISLGEGLRQTIQWYQENRNKKDTRYDIFAKS